MIQERTINDVAALWYDAAVVAQYPKDLTMDFPQGTAMVWDSANCTAINISHD